MMDSGHRQVIVHEQQMVRQPSPRIQLSFNEIPPPLTQERHSSSALQEPYNNALPQHKPYRPSPIIRQYSSRSTDYSLSDSEVSNHTSASQSNSAGNSQSNSQSITSPKHMNTKKKKVKAKTKIEKEDAIINDSICQLQSKVLKLQEQEHCNTKGVSMLKHMLNNIDRSEHTTFVKLCAKLATAVSRNIDTEDIHVVYGQQKHPLLKETWRSVGLNDVDMYQSHEDSQSEPQNCRISDNRERDTMRLFH